MESHEAVVGVIMGSASAWDAMQHCAKQLKDLGIPFEKKVISAHRTPDLLVEYARGAEGRGIKIIIAAAGGAAHLAGVTAAFTHLPIIGVPMMGWSLEGLDSVLSMVNMPRGVPVLTMSLGKAGAVNAAIAAAEILALSDSGIRSRVLQLREAQAKSVIDATLPDV